MANSNYLPTEFQGFIHTSRYAKFIDGKRETWSQTVARYIDNVVYTELGGDPEQNAIIDESIDDCGACA